MAELDAVTGAFGYSGKYITRKLLDAGIEVRTLTSSPQRDNPFGNQVKVAPLAFDDSAQLTAALRGAAVLINTYWVRFNYRGRGSDRNTAFAHRAAVENTRRLFTAAGAAGVRRIVHVSITNPSEDSPLEYFRGKAQLERTLRESGLSYAILRPAVLFGHEDILVNNIAWALRRLPFFGVFGHGRYRLQPIHVEDFAELAVRAAGQGHDQIIDAIGPETFEYRELVARIAEIIGCRRPILSVPVWLGSAIARVLGLLVNDVVLTRDEIAGLIAGLLCTGSPPAGSRRLSDWAVENANALGRRYASELARRRDRRREYGAL